MEKKKHWQVPFSAPPNNLVLKVWVVMKKKKKRENESKKKQGQGY
jgi:hypothetical protein